MEEVIVNIGDRVQKQIDLCLNMKPDDNTHEVDEIREKLDKLVSKPNESKQKLRSNNLNADKRKLDNTFQELSSDLVKMDKNFECLIECFYTLLDKIDELSDLKEKLVQIEHRILKLENGSVSELSTPGRRSVACGVGDQSSRIDRLEYLSSERERENCLLQVVITHPDIDNNSLHPID